MGIAGFKLGNIGVEFLLSLWLLASAVALAIVAFPILVARVRNDSERCARGRFTYWLMLAGYCLGGLVAILQTAALQYAVLTLPLIGLLAGGVLGNGIGRVMMHRIKLQDEEVRV